MSIRSRLDSSHRAVAGSWPARRAQHRLLWPALVVVFLAAYWFHAWWVSPEHRIAQFVAALRRADTAAMLSLAGAREVKRLGLTAEKFDAMLADAAGTPGGLIVSELRWWPLGEEQSQYNRWGSVRLYAKNGSPLVNAGGFPLRVVIQAYNTDEGWKIGGSKFVYATLVDRTGMEYRKERYAALCWRHGVPPEFYSPEKGDWEHVPPAQ